MKIVTVAKFYLAFTRCRNNLKTVGNLPVKSSLQDFDAKEVCLHLRIDQSRSKSVEKFSVFIIYKCSQNIVSKMFRFQNLPFSKFAGKNVPFSCEQEAYPLNFSPLSKCAGIV